jgi:hypothetical protein
VTATEQQIAANSIEEGTWTVGRDIGPAPTAHRSPWAVTATGRSPAAAPTATASSRTTFRVGGIPTVTLREARTSNGCGTFVKQ